MLSDTFKFNLVFLILSAIMLSFSVAGALIPTTNNNVCSDAPKISEDTYYIYMESSCFRLSAPKSYHNEISFFDKINNQPFDLKLDSIEEQRIGGAQKRITTFSSMDFNAKITENNEIRYSDKASEIILIYKIENNKVKANLEMKNFTAQYPESRLILNTRIHQPKTNLKNDVEIKTLAPIINDKEAKLTYSEKVSGINTFQEQVLFEGTGFDSLIIDPLYEIDINTTNPSYQLVNGVSILTDDNSFASYTDISSILSDDNFFTGGYSNIGTPFLVNNLITTFNFNTISNIDTKAYNDYEVDIFPSVTLQYPTSELYGYSFTGVPNHVLLGSTNQFQMNNSEFTFCARFDSTAGTTDQHIISLGNSGARGYRLFQTSGENLRCQWWGSTSNNYIQFGSADVHSTGWHTACCSKDNTNIQMWVDGNIVLNSAIAIGNVNTLTNSILTIGGTSTLESNRYFVGYVDGVAFYDKFLTDAEMDLFQGTGIFYNYSKGSGISAFFNHSIDADEDYTMRIYSNTNSAISTRVYAYQSMTALNTTNYEELTLTKGYNYLPINGFVGTNYNYPFRIVNLQNINLSITEISLNEIINDTSPPIIDGTWVNDTIIDCDDNVNLFVNVTDETAITSVSVIFNSTAVGQGFPVNLIYYDDYSWYLELTAQEITDIFTSIGWDFSDNVTISIIRINATDVLDQTSENYYPPITALYTCVYECVENWQPIYGDCETNDTKLLIYDDINSCGTYDDLPIDNGTYTSCNYCSEDLEKLYISTCKLINGTGQTEYEWHDNNYLSCCILTTLASDCSILSSPYNESGYEVCLFGFEDFILEMDNQALFGLDFTNNIKDRIYGKINLQNYSSNNFSCISYVKDIDGNIMQVNPVYDINSQTLITLNNNIENRQVFTTNNGIANVYWTQEKLVKDMREYLFGVECSDGTQTLKSEKVLETGYLPPSDAWTRAIWGSSQPVILAIFLILFALIVGWALFKLIFR